MQKSFKDQIMAIQKARRCPNKPLLIEGATAKQYDQCLNDAGATIAALKLAVSEFQKQPRQEKQMEMAYNFFKYSSKL